MNLLTLVTLLCQPQAQQFFPRADPAASAVHSGPPGPLTRQLLQCHSRFWGERNQLPFLHFPGETCVSGPRPEMEEHTQVGTEASESHCREQPPAQKVMRLFLPKRTSLGPETCLHAGNRECCEHQTMRFWRRTRFILCVCFFPPFPKSVGHLLPPMSSSRQH